MNIKNLFKGALSSVAALTTVGVALAQRSAQEAACVPIPAEGINLQAMTGGMSYIMAGGTGPVLILAVAFVVGLIVSHIIWGGF